MKKKLLYLLAVFFFTNAAIADSSSLSLLVQTANEEEALFLRRIVDFWEEGEYFLVKRQIEDYISENFSAESFSRSLTPSPFWNYLHALLGDLYTKDKEFKKAAITYKKISDQNIKSKIYLNYLQALYEIKWFDPLYKESSNFLKQNSSKSNYFKVIYLIADSKYQQMQTEKIEEKKTALAKETKMYFENLINTPYEEEALYSLANLNYILKDYKSTSDMYLMLAEKFEDKKEDFLFQAAILQADYDKKMAINTFSEIWKIGKDKAIEALYNQMLLNYEIKDYESVINLKNKLLNNLDKDKLRFVNYFIGRSYFMLNDLESAKKHLDYFIKENEKTPELKIALIALLDYASKISDVNLYNNYMTKYQEVFSDDEKIPYILFERALLNKKSKKFLTAKQDFEYLEEKYPFLNDEEDFSFEYALLYYNMENWEVSRVKFKLFSEKYKDSTLQPLAWRYLINSSINNIRTSKDEDVKYDKYNLIYALEQFLEKDFATDDEKQEYTYLLAQTKFSLEDYDEALLDFKTLAENFQEHPQIAEIYLLLAFCYKNQYKDYKNFTTYAKKAISIKPAFLEKTNVLLAFFNAYIELAKEDGKNYSLAAENLFAAYTQDPNQVQTENIIWLSDFYYEKINKYLEKDWVNSIDDDSEIQLMTKRAIELKKKAINKKISTIAQNIFIEPQILKLAALYGKSKKTEKQIFWLKKLQVIYQENPNVLWLSKNQASFDLSCLFEKIHEYEKAKMGFETLLSNIAKSSPLYPEALLHKTRISLASLTNRTFNNPELVNNLANLKNLLLQKKLQTEPVHLEAALDYVDLQCTLENKKTKEEKRLFLLARIKTNFASNEDISSKDYHLQRMTLPKKNKIYNAYIKFINAEIALTKALVEKKDNPSKSSEYKQKAREMFNSLKNENLIITAFLQKRLEKKMKILEEK